jgi:hypothetical protein
MGERGREPEARAQADREKLDAHTGGNGQLPEQLTVKALVMGREKGRDERAELEGGHPRIEVRLLSDVADVLAPRRRDTGAAAAKQRHPTSVGGEDARQHLDESRLAGTVFAEEAVGLALLEAQRDRANRHLFPE